MKIYGYSNSFKKAKSKASIAQDTSHIGTDSSEEEIRSRKRKLPRKFNCSDNEEGVTQISKMKKLHQVPATPQITDSLLNMLPIASDASDFPMASRDGSMHSQATTPSREVATQNSLSDIPIHSRSTTPSREVAEQNTLINHLLQSMEKLQKDVMEINKKVDAVLSKFAGRDFPTIIQEPFPPGFKFPIDFDEDLIILNNKLIDNQLQTTLIRHLHAEATGKSSRSFITSIIKVLLSKNVAVLYSRLGRKGKKSFMELKQVFKAVLTAASLKFPKSSKEELADIFGKVLAGAGDWEGRSSRPSDGKTSRIMDSFSFLNMSESE